MQENLKLENYFLKLQIAISRTPGPILGLFVLILMHFHAEFKYSNGSLNFELFWKNLKILSCHWNLTCAWKRLKDYCATK